MPEVEAPEKVPGSVDDGVQNEYIGDGEGIGPKTTNDAGKTVSAKNQKENLHGTSDEAAEKALNKYNSQSIEENREYGGLIYKDADGQYGHTDGIRGSIDGVSPWSGEAIPSGTDEVGYWHKHGNYSKMENGKLVPTGNKNADWYDSDNFSPQDIDVANEMAKEKSEYKGYVGTPGGEFKGYDAKTGKQYKLEGNK
jgi:hypothetical protein